MAKKTMICFFFQPNCAFLLRVTMHEELGRRKKEGWGGTKVWEGGEEGGSAKKKTKKIRRINKST